jgi:hypothetical protein
MTNANYIGASNIATNALEQRQGKLCPDEYSTLAALWYKSSTAVLLQPPSHNSCYDLQLRIDKVVAWYDLDRRAADYGILSSDRNYADILKRAGEANMWMLADAVQRRMWFERGMKLDSDTVNVRFTNLRSAGRNLAECRPVPSWRSMAIDKLATAHRINLEYALENSIACDDLKELGVQDCSEIEEEDFWDPLLLTGAPASSD